MTTIDSKYLELVYLINKEGEILEGRNGNTKTLVDEFPQIKWDLSEDAFPILSIRKQNLLHYINEFLWEVNGGYNVYDLDNVYAPVDSSFLWNTWATEDGSIPYSYGSCWRNNGELTAKYSVDQLRIIEDELIRCSETNSRSRRLTLITQDVMKNAITAVGGWKNAPKQVPPCHPCIQFTLSKDKLNAHVFSRSQDIVVGFPGDAIRYSLLTMCLAKMIDIKPGKVCFSFSDVHYYMEHEDKLNKILDDFEPSLDNYPLLSIDGYKGKRLSEYKWQDFELSHYVPSKFYSFPLIA